MCMDELKRTMTRKVYGWKSVMRAFLHRSWHETPFAGKSGLFTTSNIKLVRLLQGYVGLHSEFLHLHQVSTIYIMAIIKSICRLRTFWLGRAALGGNPMVRSLQTSMGYSVEYTGKKINHAPSVANLFKLHLGVKVLTNALLAFVSSESSSGKSVTCVFWVPSGSHSSLGTWQFS